MTSQTVSVSTLTRLELHGEDSHTNKIASMNSLVALSNYCLNTLKVRTLGSPITRGTRTVLVTSENNSLLTSIHVLFGSIKDSHLFTSRNVDGGRTGLASHLVDETNISESTSSHDFIITSSGTIRVEIFFADTLGFQVFSGRGILSNLTSG